jgi:mannose-6-phosphate isomerase-like protein (cupin superfamily)
MQRMKDITTLHLASIAAYSGPHEIPGIRFRPARAALGVSAWGMNVLELDAGCEAYPEHEHSKDGQEEVYFVVRGGGELVAGEQRVALTEGTFVRVAPSRHAQDPPRRRGHRGPRDRRHPRQALRADHRLTAPGLRCVQER